MEDLGVEPFFSDFRIHNPQSQTGYRGAIRGLRPGDNFRSCPDHATNELGTCKHIEFTLAQLERKRGAKATFVRGYHPSFSEFLIATCAVQNMRMAFKRSLSACILDGGTGKISRMSHSSIERDPATGARSLKVPLPPPEAAARLADALSEMAQALRRAGSPDRTAP